MEPFEGGPGEPTADDPEKKLASRSAVMEAAACATGVLILALLIIGSGGLLLMDLGFLTWLGWGVLVLPVVFFNGVLLRKLRRNQHAEVADRISKLSAVLMTTGAIGLSILAAAISFVYCYAAYSRVTFIH
ncbi:hypothetical protein AB1K70_09855 [Bremerella sp. JC770]|uniref:hypothetical protein n=1 Tax=Bremerella sp. JC770 TaxID=3232137 RepID=UPI00345AF032